ncbi:MAG: LacI family transcriptional regulator [Firmicutes bacterium]|nr:LacI family transcriptional regulator [Bacillota bacterium]
MTTIYDVAKIAGVSVSTVSRVLNDSGPVSDETRKKVEEAVAAVGYRPNPSARSLRTQKTDLIALIVPDIINEYFSVISRGVQDVVEQHGYHMLLCNTDGNENAEIDYMQMLENGRVDGFIITPPGPNLNQNADDYLRSLGRADKPFVMIGDRLGETGVCDIVTADTSVGTREAMMHLLESGHSMIAYLGGPEAKSVATNRLKAYKQGLSRRGLSVNKELIYETDLSLQGGYETARRMIDQWRSSPSKSAGSIPTAIFAVNDMVAIGVIMALRDYGLRVPEDVAVVGFDDVPLASFIQPRLTTVAQPKYDLGRLAAERLMLQIADTGEPKRKIILPTRLVVRESTQPRQDVPFL